MYVIGVRKITLNSLKQPSSFKFNPSGLFSKTMPGLFKGTVMNPSEGRNPYVVPYAIQASMCGGPHTT